DRGRRHRADRRAVPGVRWRAVDAPRRGGARRRSGHADQGRRTGGPTEQARTALTRPGFATATVVPAGTSVGSGARGRGVVLGRVGRRGRDRFGPGPPSRQLGRESGEFHVVVPPW